MENTPQWLMAFIACCAFVVTRHVIHSKDIVRITGVAERTARKILQKIRERHNKTKEMFVTILEFCEYTGLREEDVRQDLR